MAENRHCSNLQPTFSSFFLLSKCQTPEDGKVKWYFIQSMRQDYGEPMFYTVDGDLIRGRVKADYSDYATLAKQLWCFETEDGESGV